MPRYDSTKLQALCGGGDHRTTAVHMCLSVTSDQFKRTLGLRSCTAGGGTCLRCPAPSSDLSARTEPMLRLFQNILNFKSRKRYHRSRQLPCGAYHACRLGSLHDEDSRISDMAINTYPAVLLGVTTKLPRGPEVMLVRNVSIQGWREGAGTSYSGL